MTQPRMSVLVLYWTVLASLLLGHLSLVCGRVHPVPVLYSISGCTDSGPSTLNCLTGTTLTVTGDDFSPYFYPKSTLWSLFVDITGFASHPGFIYLGNYFNPYRISLNSSRLLDNQTVELTLFDADTTWRLLLDTVFANASVRSLFIITAGGASNGVNISFAGISPPEVTTVEAGPLVVNSLDSVLPGTYTLFFRGDWLTLPMTVAVGTGDGQWSDCANLIFTDFYSRQWEAILPSLPLAQPDQPHYIRLSRPGIADVLLPDKIYVAGGQPIISSIAPCVYSAAQFTPSTYQHDEWWPLKCQPSSVVTVLGNYFDSSKRALDAALVFTTFDPSIQMNCTQVAIVNSSMLTCTLPADAAPSADQYTATLYLSSSYYSAPFQYVNVYDSPNAVRIASANCTGGWADGSPLSLHNCTADGLLTLSLYWLGGVVPPLLTAADISVGEVVTLYTLALQWRRWGFTCGDVQLSADTAGSAVVTCTLPSAADVGPLAGVQDEVTFIVRQQTDSGTLTSNVLHVNVNPMAAVEVSSHANAMTE